jgi:tRNA(Ile)-lysidine synthase TilS/MesJ
MSFPAPPWSRLGKKIESMCRKALYEYELLEGCEKIAIALSGGKDSLTLLFMLHAILGRGFPKLPLVAIHVDGAFSCGAGLNQKYLQEVCDAMSVKLVVKNATQSLDTLECYSCSRQRRSLIFEAAKEEGASTIAFGHHRDDSIQTLMMNLLHKAEFAANLPKVPMKDYGVTIIRPLIYVSEDDIVTFARQHAFERVMCGCPVGQNSMRRQVELLIKGIEERFPNARENLAIAGRKYGTDKAMKP